MMIDVNNLHVGTRLLPMSFECERGSCLHIIGPNGSGKSTLLAALAGMIPYQGQVCFGTDDIASLTIQDLAARRAYLAQNERPVFAVDVYHYLILSVPDTVRVEPNEISDVIGYLSDRLNLQDKLSRSIHQISGGEWQRVRLAGSCLQIWPSLNPEGQYLILDEPASALDVGQENLMYDLLGEIRAMGITILMANHDLNRTYRHASDVVLLNRGVLYRSGRPKDVLNTESIQEVFHTNVQAVDIKGKSYLLFD